MTTSSTAAAPGTPTADLTATPATVAATPPPATPKKQTQSQETRAELAAIDATLRDSTLLFFGSAIAWLLLGSALGILAWAKMVIPDFLTGIGWTTTGRLWPAQQDVFVYGFAGSAGLGAGLWMMARLCRVPLRHGGVLFAAWALWNLGLTIGVWGVLNGESTGVQWLNFPRYAALLIFTAYTFIAIWAVLMFRYRREGHTYVSQWYLAAAFLWFPWIYATANLVEFFLPVQPAAQAAVHWWYSGNLFGVWLAPFALASAYYIAPKALNTPVHRYGLAVFAFWTFLFLNSWSGLTSAIGGPLPAWMITLAIVASTLTLAPLSAIYTNFHGMCSGRAAGLKHSPSLRFTIVGVYLFLAWGLLNVINNFRWANTVTHFTVATTAQQQLFLYGFVGLCLFGAIYYITPRLLLEEWPSSGLIRAHFWSSVVGLGISVVSLWFGGLIQGLGLEDAAIPSAVLFDFVRPFLLMGGLGALIMAVGSVCLAASFGLMLAGVGRRLAIQSYETWDAAQTVSAAKRAAALNPVAEPLTPVP